jgi:hypothetical protein
VLQASKENQDIYSDLEQGRRTKAERARAKGKGQRAKGESARANDKGQKARGERVKEQKTKYKIQKAGSYQSLRHDSLLPIFWKRVSSFW